MAMDNLMVNSKFFNDEDKNCFIESLKSAVKDNFVSEFAEGKERPCESSDFFEHRKKVESNIVKLNLILQNVIKCDSLKLEQKKIIEDFIYIDREFFTLILILCGENSELKPWNTQIITNCCHELIIYILKEFKCKDLVELFLKYSKYKITKDVLQFLQPKLFSTTWKHYPAAVVCYKWILTALEQSNLSDNLPFVIPTVLLLLDDFVVENKITGIQCVNHIVHNVTVAELQFCGYGDVIYSALIPMLRLKEAELILNLLPSLISLSTKLEMDLKEKRTIKWSRFDNILEIYLESMEYEQSLELRSAFIENLELVISASGFNITKWTKRLLKIFREYIQTAGKNKDSKTIQYTLKAAGKFTEFTTPVINFYAENLFYTLLRALCISYSFYDVQNIEISISYLNNLLEKTSEDAQNSIKLDLKAKLNEEKLQIDFYEKFSSLLKL